MKINIIAKKVINKFKGKQKLHFIHIGKTGGSAIKFSLKGHAITKDFEIILHGHKTKLKDIPNGEKFFFCVRDPIERFVSGFYSRKRQGKPNYNSPWRENEKIAFGLFNTPNDLASALSNVDDKVKSNAIFAMQSIAHVNTSYWDWFLNEGYLKERAPDLFFVCRQHKLKADFKKLIGILGVSKDLELPDKNSVAAHANPEKLDKRLDDKARTNLREWYATDYHFLDIVNETW